MRNLRTFLCLALAPILMVGLTQCNKGSSPESSSLPEKDPSAEHAAIDPPDEQAAAPVSERQELRIAVADLSAVQTIAQGDPALTPEYFEEQRKLLTRAAEAKSMARHFEGRIAQTQQELRDTEKSLASAKPEEANRFEGQLGELRSRLTSSEKELAEAKRIAADTPKAEVSNLNELEKRMQQAGERSVAKSGAALDAAIKRLFAEAGFNVLLEPDPMVAKHTLAPGVGEADNLPDVTDKLIAYVNAAADSPKTTLTDQPEKLRVARASFRQAKQAHPATAASAALSEELRKIANESEANAKEKLKAFESENFDPLEKELVELAKRRGEKSRLFAAALETDPNSTGEETSKARTQLKAASEEMAKKEKAFAEARVEHSKMKQVFADQLRQKLDARKAAEAEKEKQRKIAVQEDFERAVDKLLAEENYSLLVDYEFAKELRSRIYVAGLGNEADTPDLTDKLSKRISELSNETKSK